MKKIPKYIVYAGIAAAILLLIYALFQSTRETFTSVNPIPTEAELTALEATFSKAQAERSKNNLSIPQIGTNALQSAPQSVKVLAKFIKDNVIPLLPYKMMKNAQTPDGDVTDYFLIAFMTMATQPLLAPLAYAVRQQSSAPALPEFVDMVIKILKENGRPPPPPDWPMGDKNLKAVVDQMKNVQTTIQTPEGETFPNPAYWLHKYIYGEAKTLAKSGPASATSSAGKGISAGAGGGGGKCTPSVTPVPGGVSEIRCFN